MQMLFQTTKSKQKIRFDFFFARRWGVKKKHWMGEEKRVNG
jgi:hypothetical protein